MHSICSFQERIQSYSLEEARLALQRHLSRDPSLVFDLLPPVDQSAPPPNRSPGQPTWCTCQRCKEMPTDLERKCCGQCPEYCVSTLPHFELYILDAAVLRLSLRIWNDIRAVQDAPDSGESLKQFRHAAHRQFVVWQYGALGPGHRVVIPSCCIWKIRDQYPDPHGQYTGYVPCRI